MKPKYVFKAKAARYGQTITAVYRVSTNPVNVQYGWPDPDTSPYTTTSKQFKGFIQHEPIPFRVTDTELGVHEIDLWHLFAPFDVELEQDLLHLEWGGSNWRINKIDAEMFKDEVALYRCLVERISQGDIR